VPTLWLAGAVDPGAFDHVVEPRLIGQCAVEGCFAEAADGSLASHIDAQTTSNTLTAALAGHADVDGLLSLSFAGDIHTGLSATLTASANDSQGDH
jgi:hypothetical protein